MTVARDNLDALTGLRFVAAFTIALGHSIQPWLAVAGIGMPLFFTLSGFIIHHVYSASFAAGWRSAGREFAIARVSRLYPLYFALFAYAFLFTPMGPPLRTASNLPILLAYLFGYWSWWPYQVDGHILANWYFGLSWSVSTETFFYIVYALCLYRLARIRSIGRCLLALAGLCIAAYLLFYTLFLTRDAWETFVLARLPQFPARTTSFNDSFYRWFLYISPYCRIFEFTAGVLTAQLFRLVRAHGVEIRVLRPGAIATVGAVLLLSLFVPFCILGETNPWLAAGNHSAGAFLVTLHMNFLFAPACCLLIFSLALGGSTLAAVLSSRPCRRLGDISYSTYLSHPMASRILLHGGIVLTGLPYLIVIFAVIYAMSAILYATIEVPAKRWLRRMLDRHQPVRGLFSGGA